MSFHLQSPRWRRKKSAKGRLKAFAKVSACLIVGWLVPSSQLLNFSGLTETFDAAVSIVMRADSLAHFRTLGVMKALSDMTGIILCNYT